MGGGGRARNTSRVLVEKTKGNDNLGDLGIYRDSTGGLNIN
jgi:hypothetical protein